MSWFPRPVSPRAALADFVAFTRQRSREQLIGAALALLSTMIMVVIFFADSKVNTATPPQIVYVEQWSANRTDAEIIAEQKTHQAQREAALKERQRQFKKLGKQLGIE
jgi:hypothetical protein